MTRPDVTVVIRAKDEAASIGRVLALLAKQTVPARIVVVDSGSRDDTVAIARAAGAVLLEIPAAAFTYGRALNLGCAAADTPFLVALSAHAFPPDEGWLARMLAPFAGPRTAATVGVDRGPRGEPLDGPVVQDAALAERFPQFGYSNAAGAFRTELWRVRGFREDMPFTEDREWALHWLREGWTVTVDPALAVEHDHSKDPVAQTFRRARDEWRGFGMFLDVEAQPARRALETWWRDQETYRNRARARLSHRRAARLAGGWWGRRLAARGR